MEITKNPVGVDTSKNKNAVRNPIPVFRRPFAPGLSILHTVNSNKNLPIAVIPAQAGMTAFGKLLLNSQINQSAIDQTVDFKKQKGRLKPETGSDSIANQLYLSTA